MWTTRQHVCNLPAASRVTGSRQSGVKLDQLGGFARDTTRDLTSGQQALIREDPLPDPLCANDRDGRLNRRLTSELEGAERCTWDETHRNFSAL
jgi:hypothetical protein